MKISLVFLYMLKYFGDSVFCHRRPLILPTSITLWCQWYTTKLLSSLFHLGQNYCRFLNSWSASWYIIRLMSPIAVSWVLDNNLNVVANSPNAASFWWLPFSQTLALSWLGCFFDHGNIGYAYCNPFHIAFFFIYPSYLIIKILFNSCPRFPSSWVNSLQFFLNNWFGCILSNNQTRPTWKIDLNDQNSLRTIIIPQIHWIWPQ